MKWTVSVCLLLLALTGCGGKAGSTSNQLTVPAQYASLEGNWEILAASTQGQGGQLIETMLNYQVTGVGDQTPKAFYIQNSTLAVGASWPCEFTEGGFTPMLQLTVSGSNAQFQLQSSSGVVLFAGQGTITNNSSVTGTYSQPAPCADQGTFTATKVPAISGTYSGTYDGVSTTAALTDYVVGGTRYPGDFPSCLSIAFTGGAGANGTDVCQQRGAYFLGMGTVGYPDPVGSGNAIINGFVVTTANANLQASGSIGPINVGNLVLMDDVSGFGNIGKISGVLQ
jgi:hypothetical protein